MNDLLITIPKILSIFALAWFSFWPAIPAGLALGLSPLLVIATTTLSYVSGVVLVALFGGRVRDWALRRLGRQTAGQSDTLIARIWQRFGIIGLGLAAPMTVGAQIGAALGISLNAPSRRLLLWMSLGALAWSIALTLAVLLGVVGAQAIGG
ncbi:MAG: small multi-drug export protein [Anaerolineae bacterium]|nr:small multi-drug export protein [Anaerolineae bacterium]